MGECLLNEIEVEADSHGNIKCQMAELPDGWTPDKE